ncbi:MAG: glycoside hydrolase domain-containing protein, partial [Mycobacteriales bacterium]
GHPGPDQQCPAHAVGHAPTLLIEPYDTTARSHVTPAAQRTAASDGTGQLQVLSADHTVMVTATYASSAAGGSSDGSAADPAPGSATPGSTTPASPPALSGRAAAEALLAGGTALSATPPLPTTPADSAATTTGPAGAGPDTVYQESTLGFDTCAAPSVNTMAAWRASPYRTVGVYIGGINRACGYGNLSSGWLQTVRSYGYGFIPTYVGPQAPCSGIGEPMPTDPSAVTTLATQNAYGAVLDMRAFGLGQGNPVYFDLEYFHGDATCHATVVRYFDAWTRELHRRGYLSAVYSSSSSLADFVAHYNDSSFARPDALWMASWNGSHSVYGNSTVPDSQWNPHRRIHQYSGGEYHTYGGYTLNIDGDYADAPVGAPGTQTGTPPPTPLNATSLAGATLLGPGAASSGPGHLAVVTRGSNGQVYYRYASGNVWSAWALALPGVPSSNPGVISWGGSQLHIFARDRRNHLIQAWQDGGPIQGWQNLGGCLRSGPGVAMSGPGTAYVTVRGCNNHVYLKEYLGHGWSRWFDLGGSVTSDPAVITWRNHLQVFARGVHGRLWSRWENYGRWSRWALVNGGQVLGGPAAASIGPGKTDVYIRSRRGYLYNLSQRPGQGWSGWHATNVYATSDAAVSTNGSHRNDVFYRGSAGDVQHRWYAR